MACQTCSIEEEICKQAEGRCLTLGDLNMIASSKELRPSEPEAVVWPPAVLAAAPNKPACAGGTSTKGWKSPACATIQTGLFRNKPACAGGTSTKVRKIQLVSRPKRIFSATNEPKSERHPKGCARFSYQSKNILLFRAKAHKTIVIMQNAARTAQISIFGFQ